MSVASAVLVLSGGQTNTPTDADERYTPVTLLGMSSSSSSSSNNNNNNNNNQYVKLRLI